MPIIDVDSSGKDNYLGCSVCFKVRPIKRITFGNENHYRQVVRICTICEGVLVTKLLSREPHREKKES
jgi:hypothetical protein